MRFKKPVADGRTTWSVAEEETIRDLTKQGKTLKDMKHIFPKRSDTSIKNKIRKIRFKENNYGAEHRQEKYDLVADRFDGHLVFHSVRYAQGSGVKKTRKKVCGSLILDFPNGTKVCIHKKGHSGWHGNGTSMWSYPSPKRRPQ